MKKKELNRKEAERKATIKQSIISIPFIWIPMGLATYTSPENWKLNIIGGLLIQFFCICMIDINFTQKRREERKQEYRKNISKYYQNSYRDGIRKKDPTFYIGESKQISKKSVQKVEQQIYILITAHILAYPIFVISLIKIDAHSPLAISILLFIIFTMIIFMIWGTRKMMNIEKTLNTPPKLLYKIAYWLPVFSLVGIVLFYMNIVYAIEKQKMNIKYEAKR